MSASPLVDHICLNCCAPAVPPQLYCTRCGCILPHVFDLDLSHQQVRRPQAQRSMELEWGTTYFHPRARLFIRNECGPQVLSVPVRAEPVLLGRGGGDKKPTSYIDLSALGASARMGVARYHAQIELQGDMLYLSDYGSGEGTVLNCKPIPSHVPIPLRNRSLVHLGGLALRVQFV